jgi:hypothetical protein
MRWSVVGVPWLDAVMPIMQRDTELLRTNGAIHCADARDALLKQLSEALQDWGDTEVEVNEAARMAKCSAETIRRAIRSGSLSAVGMRSKKIRRRDIFDWLYSDDIEVTSDAQDIAHKRRQE